MGLDLTPGPVASAFIIATATGTADEILALGPRGEGKTISALIAMGFHAKLHEAAGYPLPVPWMGVTDTFNSHKEKTIDSLKKLFWGGAWQVHDGGHKAVLKTNKEAVVLSLFGIEDKGALDRVRKETCCTWIEEPTPTDEGAGVREDAMDLGITSQRVPTHAPVTMLTSNYPDDEHWVWKRFQPVIGKYGLNVHPDDPKRVTYQIPKGDNAYLTAAMRAKWYERLKDRPELVARLLDGKPAVIYQGRAVAMVSMNGQSIGFNEARHISATRLKPIDNVPFILGQDGGLTPVTTIGQEYHGVIRIYASMCVERGGMRQQYQYNVLPWFKRYAPWAVKESDTMILGGYDPSFPDDESDSDVNPLDVIRELLGGVWIPGPVDWDSRKGALFGAFNRGVGGEPGLLIDPTDAMILRKALNGHWNYKTDRFDQPIKETPQTNHPYDDAGQSLCYLLCRALPELSKTPRPPLTTSTYFDPRRVVQQPINANSRFNPLRKYI